MLYTSLSSVVVMVAVYVCECDLRKTQRKQCVETLFGSLAMQKLRRCRHRLRFYYNETALRLTNPPNQILETLTTPRPFYLTPNGVVFVLQKTSVPLKSLSDECSSRVSLHTLYLSWHVSSVYYNRQTIVLLYRGF